ncbi:unnamed protein product, partial [Didymodactylos carnosus]
TTTNPALLCNNVFCANGGVCNIVTTAQGVYQAQCQCLLGFAGDNCELQAIGATVYAYCSCLPGFYRPNCDTRYFACPFVGTHADTNYCRLEKYFTCTSNGAGLTLTQSVCPKGSKYNPNLSRCDPSYQC